MTEMEALEFCQECGGSVAALLPDSDVESRRRPVQISLSGLIDGFCNFAALTNGDGACSLHSLWGEVPKRGGALVCPGSRARLKQFLEQQNIDQIRDGHGGVLIAKVDGVLSCSSMHSVWRRYGLGNSSLMAMSTWRCL